MSRSFGPAVRADPIPSAVLATAVIAVLAMMRLVRTIRFQVEGDSMRPLLWPGDRLLVRPVPRSRLRPGDVVVLRDPRRRQRRIVKRLDRVAGHRAWALGDNPAASTDSRTFGWVGLPLLVARPVRRYAPADRAGPLPGRGGAARPVAAKPARADPAHPG